MGIFPTQKVPKWPNGGVAEGAKVEPTGFVGPDAGVLSGTLSGMARVENFAIVAGSTLADQAVVAGLSVIGRNLTRRWSAQLRGDAYFKATATIDRGIFYGSANDTNASDFREGANRGPRARGHQNGPGGINPLARLFKGISANHSRAASRTPLASSK